MTTKTTNSFMLNLIQRLVDGGLAESSATLYLKNMLMLNNNKPFKSVAFLKNIDNVMDKIKDYKPNTKIGIIGSVLGVLKIFKDIRGYGKVIKEYRKIQDDIVKEKLEETPKGTKTETQKENWIEWEQIEERKKQLKQMIEPFKNKKNISPEQYGTILLYFVLSLYTDLAPRRNKDYQDMFIAFDATDKNKDVNYLDYSNKRFIFNNYKTAKTYGEQIVDFADNEKFIEALELYLKHHPLLRGKKITKKTPTTAFLVASNGLPFQQNNDMTRLLNKAIGAKVGSSMLRHIYLTTKYGKDMEEKENVAGSMAHSVQQQNNYILPK